MNSASHHHIHNPTRYYNQNHPHNHHVIILDDDGSPHRGVIAVIAKAIGIIEALAVGMVSVCFFIY
jgi:hypothetical protein